MSIASRITSIEGHISDIYDTVELTGVDTTDIDKNLVNVPNTLKEGYIDIINNGTDTLYNNFPKVSGEGTSLTLNNTYQAPMRNNLKGNTSQTGTPTPTSPIPVNVVSGDNEIVVNGKNFLKLNDIAQTTTHGITYSCKDGVITLNGTVDSGGFIVDFNTCWLPSGTYYLERNSSGTATGSWQNYLRNSSGNIKQGYGDFTTTIGQEVFYRVYANAGVVYTNFVLKPSITIGTTAPTDFEPYTSNTYNIDLGNYLPNTYTPVEYIETSGNQYIDTGYQASGNLRIEGSIYTEQANTEMAICGVTYSSNAQLEIGFSSTHNRFFNYSGSVSAAVVPTESIYNKVFKFIAEVNDSSPRKKITLNVDNNISATNDNNNGNFKANTITLFTVNNGFWYKGRLYKLDIYDNNVLKRRLVPCYRNSDNEIGLYDIVGNAFYTNSGTGTFTKGNDVPNGIEFCKIPNTDYEDKFFHDEDSGKWYLHKEIGKYTFTGNESITLSATADVFYINNAYTNALINDVNVPLCTIFRGSTPQANAANMGFNTPNNYTALDSGTNKRFYFHTNVYSTTTDLATGLTGQSIYWIYETPTNTEITYQPLIEQLENLYNAMSKDGQTNISQINNDLPFIISASALKKEV